MRVRKGGKVKAIIPLMIIVCGIFVSGFVIGRIDGKIQCPANQTYLEHAQDAALRAQTNALTLGEAAERASLQAQSALKQAIEWKVIANEAIQTGNEWKLRYAALLGKQGVEEAVADFVETNRTNKPKP